MLVLAMYANGYFLRQNNKKKSPMEIATRFQNKINKFIAQRNRDELRLLTIEVFYYDTAQRAFLNNSKWKWVWKMTPTQLQ